MYFLKVLAALALLSQISACGTLLSEKDSSEEKHADSYSPHAHDPNCIVTEEELAALPLMKPLDLWDRIRSGYELPEVDHKRITLERNWYAKHPSYMSRVSDRASRYMYHIVEELEARNMPMEIALLPIVESAFDPFAYSHGRASGMWQIIPGTGKMLGLKQNWWYDGRRDVIASTDAALTYLERLHQRFDGDWLLALAAYNSGAGNVSKAIRKNKKQDKPLDFFSLDLPKETKAYVPRLLALAQLIQSPEHYAIELPSIANESYFSVVDVGSQIDLAQAAELAGVEMSTLYHLNPGFNRWATDPKGPHQLLVPKEFASAFEAQLISIPPESRVTWERYTIKNGDTLSTIAQKFDVSVSSLQSINNIRGSSIRAGKTLMVPVASKGNTHYSHSLDSRIQQRYAAVDKKQSGEQIDYTVQPGDSLWTISREYKVSVKNLARWNSMAPRDTIRPGQQLKIWTKTPKNASNSGVIRKVNYKVRNGDSLARIAQKFQVQVNDIVRWNALNKNKYLQPGQSLTLYVDVTNT